MENFNYVFSVSADFSSNDDNGDIKVHIKYDDDSGIGIDLNREFDEDSYQDGVSSMLEDLETQLSNALTAKQIRDAVQEETKEGYTDELYRAIDRLQDKIDRLERQIESMKTRDYESEPQECGEPKNPFSPFDKIWC